MIIKSWYLCFRYLTDQLKKNNNSYFMLSFSMVYKHDMQYVFYVCYHDFGYITWSNRYLVVILKIMDQKLSPIISSPVTVFLLSR